MIAPVLGTIILVITIYYEYLFIKNHKKLSFPWSDYSKKYIASLLLFLTATLITMVFRGNKKMIDLASTIYTISYFYIIYLGYSVFQRAANIDEKTETSTSGECKVASGAYNVVDNNNEIIKNFVHYAHCTLAISRKNAENWRKEYGFEPARLLWVSRSSVEGAVDPTRLHYITQTIIDFVRAHDGGVIIIDCIDFLLLYNDFRSVMKFLLSVKDNVVINGGMMIVVLSEKTLSAQEKSIIMKEFEPFREVIVIEPKLFGTITSNV